jgi:hypothetical protein
MAAGSWCPVTNYIGERVIQEELSRKLAPGAHSPIVKIPPTALVGVVKTCRLFGHGVIPRQGLSLLGADSDEKVTRRVVAVRSYELLERLLDLHPHLLLLHRG